MRSRSTSTTSSTSATSLPADNIQIFVSIGGGKIIPLNVRPCNTISDVLNFLSASTTLPVDVRLLHGGKHLAPSATVGDLALQPSATLHLLSPIRGGTASSEAAIGTAAMTGTIPTASDPSPVTDTQPGSGTATPTPTGTPAVSTPTTTHKKSNKPRCSHPPCKAAAQPIVGDCGFCQKRFCGKHRMLESHACTGLEDAKQADRDRNTAKLEGERTIMLRGI